MEVFLDEAGFHGIGIPEEYGGQGGDVVSQILLGQGLARDLGLQILGGMGYAQETHMQRYWRDARIFRIAPITTEMAKNMVGPVARAAPVLLS